MPSVESWQERPLSLIEGIFEKRTKEDWIKEVHEEFGKRLGNLDNISAVPSLNDLAAHELRPNSIVRFRCMVQDSFDNEFFLETYNLIDKDKNVVARKTSCFQDIVGSPPNLEIDADPTKCKTGMRQVLYCVSVPGETGWVKQGWKSAYCTKPNKQPTQPSTSSKRSREEDDGSFAEEPSMDGGNQDPAKRQKPSVGEGSKENSLPELNKNHPLPDEKGPVCLVKVYDESADFKVNEVIEFYGVLSVDPGLSTFYDVGADGDNDGMETGDMDEKRAHHPPASLVPRLHVVAFKRLQHINPLLLREVSPDSVIQDASAARSCLLGLLEKATFGDSLAAEYLLLHLIARIYARRNMLSLGKFSLNISGIPPNSSYPRILSNFLNELVEKVHYFPMSVEKLNTLPFIPTKNYNTNRLDTGILQLSLGTHLILDETTLQPGTMDANGIKNIQALKNVLTFQKVDYNFQFHEASFECDINMLVLSEGKSLLPCDCQVELKPRDGFPPNIEEYFVSFCSQCPTEFLEKSRNYISTVKLLEYALSEDMTQQIQEDFVAARRQDSKISADDLHAWLVLARLISISIGQKNLNSQRWERVKSLEMQRRERLAGKRTVRQQNGH